MPMLDDGLLGLVEEKRRGGEKTLCAPGSGPKFAALQDDATPSPGSGKVGWPPRPNQCKGGRAKCEARRPSSDLPRGGSRLQRDSLLDRTRASLRVRLACEAGGFGGALGRSQEGQQGPPKS